MNDYGREKAAALGITEKDVPSIVKEYRKEQRERASQRYLSSLSVGCRIPLSAFNKTTLRTLAPGGSPRLFVAKISPAGDKLLNFTEINDSNAGIYDSVPWKSSRTGPLS